MTLILLCYLCGQGEKIRLTMRGLIIAVTSYIAIFSFGSATNLTYAADIGISRDTTEVEISYEETVTVTSSQTTTTSTSDNTEPHDSPVVFNNGAPYAPIYSSSMSAQPSTESHADGTLTNIDIYMAELFALEDSFPSHEAFQANNKKVLSFIADKFAGRSVEKQIYFLGKLIDIFGVLTPQEQAAYGIDADILIPLFQFMIIKGEAEPMQEDKTMPGAFAKFDLSYPLEGMTTFKMKDGEQVTRLNIYVNKRFIRSCERNQCDYFSLDATAGDLIEIFYSDGNHGTIIDQYTL